MKGFNGRCGRMTAGILPFVFATGIKKKKEEEISSVYIPQLGFNVKAVKSQLTFYTEAG